MLTSTYIYVEQDASKNYVNGLTSVVKYYDETKNRCRHLYNVNYKRRCHAEIYPSINFFRF